MSEAQFDSVCSAVMASVEAQLGIKPEKTGENSASLRVYDSMSGAFTNFQILVGPCTPGRHLAEINGALGLYASPNDIANMVAKTFRREYAASIRGI